MIDEQQKQEERGTGDDGQWKENKQEVRSPKSEVQHHGLFRHHCKKCDALEKECAEYKSGWQRAVADYQNLKKETESRISEWAQMSEQQILEEFLPVYDNFHKAFAVGTGRDLSVQEDNWVKGIECIMKQFDVVLKAHGIEEIKTVGEVFNPELHEAVGEEQSDQTEQTILKEVEAGYTMRGKVIKAAKVIVNKKSNSPNF